MRFLFSSEEDRGAERIVGKRVMKLRTVVLPVLLFTVSTLLPASFLAQDQRVRIDKSRIPAEADKPNDFVPPGWKVEEQVTGDLNGDSLPDFALKLVEDKPAKKDGVATDRERALIIVVNDKSGKLARAAVTDKLLQCTLCGGAFYGVVDAPASVQIQKGILVVDQDHGSRDVTRLTYRFRYEPETKKFLLIGFDLADNDRATGMVVTESTNYLTGVRIVTRGKGKKVTTSRTQIPKNKIYLEQVDNEEFETAALERLHL